MNHSYPSPNFDDRPFDASIQHLVLHYTAGDLEQSLKWLTMNTPPNRVSSHYLISEQGEVFQLVDEAKRAWHAGISYWDGQDQLNATSIGIEMVNPGHGDHYRKFPPPQLRAALDLCQQIIARYQISPFHVLGHSDIAPGRKLDPGEKFDWDYFAENGVGIMPPKDLKESFSDLQTIYQKLIAFGYQKDLEVDVLINCFCLHYGRGKKQFINTQLDWLLDQKNNLNLKRKAL